MDLLAQELSLTDQMASAAAAVSGPTKPTPAICLLEFLRTFDFA